MLFLLLIPFLSFSQSKENLINVIKATDVQELGRLKKQFDSEFLQRELRIENFLKLNPSEKRFSIENGVAKQIYDVLPSGEILYYFTSNTGSAITSRTNHLYNGGSLGLNVQGQGMRVGVWDSGPVLDSHTEFLPNKVELMDFSSYSDHGTHVMGTIIASGVNSTLRGLAFDASGVSYDWTNDYSEMTDEAANGLLVSNHSYWIGSTLSTWILGAYDSRARQLDQIAFAAPYYLPIAAAGNDRNSSNSVISAHLSSKYGYDLIRGMQNAKNFLTVGAVGQVSNYTGPFSVSMSAFSSWGPTDDGRIKPEVVAKGVSVRSPIATSDTAFATYNGTSMASPAVSATALLLQQHYHNLFNSYMRSATLKGLIIHTADETGDYEGPDYQFGWGLVNTREAAIVINEKATSSSIINELNIADGNTYTTTVYSDGLKPLKVSISWTDRAFGTANSGTIDPGINYLVNDLDVLVTKDGVNYYPWKLNMNLFDAPATNDSTNDVDNYERVEIPNPSGVYTITVTHKGTLVGGSQNFSLIVSGSNVVLNTESFIKDGITVYPNPSKDWLTIDAASTTLEKIYFYDLQGRLVKQINSNGLNKEQINIQDLSSGVYYLNVVTSEGSISKKIVKE